jgi:hypothetical protein
MLSAIPDLAPSPFDERDREEFSEPTGIKHQKVHDSASRGAEVLPAFFVRYIV